MYELDKRKIGTFIAELRKEAKMTQKELAERLRVSDKTISKWETANGIPDISMLMPIAEVFGITVTELLQGQCMESSEKLDTKEVEAMLTQTIQLSEEQKAGRRRLQRKNVRPYFVCLVLALLEILVLFLWKGVAGIGRCVPVYMGLAAFFGLYYTFFIKIELPSYYDENKICFYTDGFMKLSVPGMYINNRNWSYIVHAGQIGANVIMLGSPVSHFIILLLQEDIGIAADFLELMVGMPLFFVMLFVPLVKAAKKYS